MTQRVFSKLEKKLACDLKPGELFITELPEPDWFERELNRAEPAIVVLLRTNVPADQIEDGDMVVYKLHISIVDREDPAPAKVNPHAPPGMKEF